MKLTGALLLLWAALLLTSGGGGYSLIYFFNGTTEEYVEYLKQYNKDTLDVLENAANIKKCSDRTLTEEDKAQATILIMSLYVSLRTCSRVTK
uniref:Uncharacterized protein n=1 Tax=Mus spicilegus TaxID=10103 RepID=A0A8C6HBU8_MUSSI